MTDTAAAAGAIDEIGRSLPFLRRHARALTGSQSSGDAYAAATLEALLQDPAPLSACSAPTVGLFRTFHTIWNSAGAPVTDEESGLQAQVQARLAALTSGTREVLLLRTMEEFTRAETAEILSIDAAEVEERLAIARREMAQNAAGKVLIIEDEAIIAMDLDGIVSDLGHTVAGTARTARQAVALGKADRPDLVLADIHLADDSSGIDAVNDLLAHFGTLPVIFITAYPERLLTGEQPEPAFLIAKPYTVEQVRSAVGQAMFFASTETLTH